MPDVIVKLKRGSDLPEAKALPMYSHEPPVIQIVGAGTARAYVWTPVGYTTVNALRRAIRQHELAQAKGQKRRKGGSDVSQG